MLVRAIVAWAALTAPTALPALPALIGGSAPVWPGTAPREVDEGDLGRNVSGLAFSTDGRVLWAVRDDPGSLLRLVLDGDGEYVVDDGWGDGRELRWPDGSGEPDAEAVTVADDRSDVVYVAAERDNDDAATSRLSVLEIPVDAGGDAHDELVATRSWDLTMSLPAADANTGLEGITWVPDSVVVAAGLVDSQGVAYDPADHPGHGSGVFVVGSEHDGALDVFVLGDRATRLATVPSGLPSVMEVAFDAATGELWAACDEHCDGAIVRLAFDGGGLTVTGSVEPPDELVALNDEGLAIGPCIDGSQSVVWSDDAATDDHVLRAATIDCTDAAETSGAAETSDTSETSETSDTASDAAAGASGGDRGRGTGVALIAGIAILAAVGVGIAIRWPRRR
ncbi:MAG: hypothetical protein U0Q03_12170 [Acidimicrobiales bacterium]